MDALTLLRVSVARIAQAAGVDNALQVTGRPYKSLCVLARTREDGWNDLAGRCVEAINPSPTTFSQPSCTFCGSMTHTAPHCPWNIHP